MIGYLGPQAISISTVYGTVVAPRAKATRCQLSMARGAETECWLRLEACHSTNARPIVRAIDGVRPFGANERLSSATAIGLFAGNTPDCGL